MSCDDVLFQLVSPPDMWMMMMMMMIRWKMEDPADTVGFLSKTHLLCHVTKEDCTAVNLCEKSQINRTNWRRHDHLMKNCRMLCRKNGMEG